MWLGCRCSHIEGDGLMLSTFLELAGFVGLVVALFFAGGVAVACVPVAVVVMGVGYLMGDDG